MSSTNSKWPADFLSWCQKELSKVLQSTVEEDLLSYLMSMEVEKDVKEYLQDLLNGQEATQVDVFLDEFFRHWRPPVDPASLQEEVAIEELVRPDRDKMALFTKNSEEKIPGPPPGFGGSSPVQHIRRPQPTGTPTEVQSSCGGGRRQHAKKTFVPLMSAKGQSQVTMNLPGRHPCQCLAQKHNLINNCVKCGRIVCSQEGSGPCLFCGAVVCTAEEETWMLKDSKKANKLREQFLKLHGIKGIGRPLDHIQGSGASQSLSKAHQHKDKLLEFDQTSASRTKVIDDESDYFSVDTNRWLSIAEKESLQDKAAHLREQKYGSRRNKAVTVDLDIGGRKAVEEKVVVDLYDEKHAKSALGDKLSGSGYTADQEVIQTHAGGLYNPAIPSDRPKFTDPRLLQQKPRVGPPSGKEGGVKPKRVDRLQDKSLQEMKDDGFCLSMHQPWAALLVAGIKRCEGRSWHSTHRGRLWIAATRKEPSPAEIEQVQQFYVTLYGNDQENLFFPLHYPTSCLLGCVDVLDCLPKEEYQEKEPQGESESEYVFIVDNPQELTVKFPIAGQHKIWRLPRDVHLAAKRGLKTHNSL